MQPLVTNRERILTEYAQLQAVMEMLDTMTDVGHLEPEKITEIKDNKVGNVLYYRDLSTKLGNISSE